MQEDHVSMGWAAARKLRRALDGLTRVLAGEALSAARALELRERRPAPATAAVRDRIRQVVDGIGPDRFLAPEIEAVVDTAPLDAAIAKARELAGILSGLSQHVRATAASMARGSGALHDGYETR